MIILAHDYSGHNGSRRTYNCLKRQYYWPGIRKQIFRHCKKCKECVLQNQGQPEKCFGHFDSPDLPMEFTCMDLVGLIHPPSSRHIPGGGVEWDELVPLAVSAYNFFPCQSSKESPFILMFGRDPITPMAKLPEQRPRYYGERGDALKKDTLRRLYKVVVQNICKAREKLPKKEEEHHSFKINDMVVVKDPDAAVFKPRYQPNFRVTTE